MLLKIYKNNIKYNSLLFLSFFLLFLLYKFLFFSINNTYLFELYLNWIIGIVLYLYAILSTEKDPFSPIYIILIAFFFRYYLSSIFLFDMNYEFIPKVTNNKKATIIALYAVNLFLFFFIIGYKSKLVYYLVKKLPLFSENLNIKRLKFFAKSITVVLLILISYMIISNGVLNFFYNYGIKSGLGKFVYLMNFVVIAPYLLFFVGYRKTSYFMIFILFIFYMLIQARGMAILTVFWFMVFLHYNGYKIFKYILLFPLLVIVAYVVGLATGSRAEELFNNLHQLFNVLKNIDWDYLLVMSVGRLEELSMYIERVPLQHDYWYGMTFFYEIYGPFIKYIPFAEDWRYVVTSIAMNMDAHKIGYAMGGTGIGEWYINFGWVGIIIGGFLYGFLYRVIYIWGVKLNSKIHLLFYIILLPIIFGMVGESFGHIFSVVYKVIPLFIILILCKLKVKKEKFV